MERVVEHAAELCRIHDAALHGLSVVDTSTMAKVPLDSEWEVIESTLRQESESALVNVEEIAGDVDVERTLVEAGKPATDIVEYAENEACDLIVMGTHGRSGVDRILLGSVAERVVRSSTVPVLTVHVQPADE